MGSRFLRFPEGKFKAVTLSYDDGCRADKRLAEILTKHGIKCTFNINSGFMGKDENDWHLTKEEIQKYIIDNGHEIAVHGERHVANGNAKLVKGIRDVLNCRVTLENEFGLIVRGMAYPDTGISRFHNGTTLPDVETYLKALDIAYARALCSYPSDFELPADWYVWLPNAHHNSENVFELIEKFVNMPPSTYHATASPKLFYLWGHAYEFDNNNNWDRIEKICENLSGKEDIWYATNIEIFDYVAAYNSLITSADGRRIYNPTLKTIWFYDNDKIYSIAPDETLYI